MIRIGWTYAYFGDVGLDYRDHLTNFDIITNQVNWKSYNKNYINK